MNGSTPGVHRRGFDQGLRVGPRPLLVPVRAGVGDGRRRLRREQHQKLLVGVRELGPRRSSPRKKWPTCTSRWRIGVHCIVFDRITSVEKPSPGT